MKALTIQQPWAWSILHGKCIENRSRTTHYRGPILIHASAHRSPKKYEESLDWIANTFGIATAAQVPMLDELKRGGIIGRAQLVDVISPGQTAPGGVDARWHQAGYYGWVLADVEAMPFVPCKGQLNLWNFDDVLVNASQLTLNSR